MPSTSILHDATYSPDGGARSFPATYDGRVRSYVVPTVAYEKLFFTLRPRQSQCTSPSSAGWLIPSDIDLCHPVFVAHSLVSAIALVRDTLPGGTLDEDTWTELTSAAIALSDGYEPMPTSAQQTEDSLSDASLPPTGPSRTRNTSLLSSAPKRRRIDPTPSPSSNKENQSPPGSIHSIPDSDLPPAQEGPAVTKVSNHNRKFQQRLKKKQEAAAQQRKVSIGLREPAESAKLEEKIAYQSIQPIDQAQIAWIIKQPVGEESDFYQETRTPYRTALEMINKARLIGSPTTWQNVAIFLEAWRDRGTPVPTRSMPIPSTAVSSQAVALPTRASGCDRAFQQAWHISQQCEQRVAAVVIEYRWAMAFLGRAYNAKVSQLREHGKGPGRIKPQAMESLRLLVDPTGTAEGKAAFTKRMALANRWYQVAETLGWGSLCLMPDNVSNRWVRDFPAHAWSLWLDVVKRVNPDAYAASMALDEWIGEQGIQGGPIEGQEKLYIEQQASHVVYEVEEVVDSDEEESASDDDAPSQPAKSSARRLRQLSLLELFKPQ